MKQFLRIVNILLFINAYVLIGVWTFKQDWFNIFLTVCIWAISKLVFMAIEARHDQRDEEFYRKLIQRQAYFDNLLRNFTKKINE